MTERKLGVYICHCGGNISDYVDVDKVLEEVRNEPGVAIARTAMFSCSDSTQQEMIDDIQEHQLDGLVVASCSPKLHLFTFRGTAERAGLNPYQYVQVNIREQCSWTHTDDRAGATEKAIRLVRAGIAKDIYTAPYEKMRLETVIGVLVIGAGIAGLRAALVAADMGMSVMLIEREEKVGGWVARRNDLFPHNLSGRDTVRELLDQVNAHEKISLFTRAELVEKTGTLGQFNVKVRVENGEHVTAQVGAVIVTAGFNPYDVPEGMFGRGLKGVLTLNEYLEWFDSCTGPLMYHGKPIHNVAYIHCVGSRKNAGCDNKYCSRYCCSAAVHTSLRTHRKAPRINQYHLYRDIRTYGKYEVMYDEACENGSLFLKYSEEEPPEVSSVDGRLQVQVKDLLTDSETLEIPVDLVVLMAGMVPREQDALSNILKLPIGKDGFYNEIHPKLRPVETVINGVYIAGTCQGPKNSWESVSSAFAAVSKAGGLLLKGYVDLDPLIAEIDPDACTWCDECTKVCPYGAIEKLHMGEKEVARVIPELCKGEGACMPVCPKNAVDLRGCRDEMVTSMIDAFMKEVKL